MEKINKLCVIIGAMLLIVAFDLILASASWVYYETPNSTLCTGTWNTTYTCAKTYDGDWGTYGRAASTPGSSANAYFNYTKPSYTTSLVKWQFKDEDNPTQNTTFNIDVCKSALSDRIRFRVETYTSSGGFSSSGLNTYCWGGSTWQPILFQESSAGFYEEGLWWGIPPIVTINSVTNITQATSAHTFNITTNVATNCTLHVDGTTFYEYPLTINVYQESANSTTCDSGTCSNDYDGFWATSTSLPITMRVNYTKPIDFNSALWQKRDSTTGNLTPTAQCLSQTNLQFRVRMMDMPFPDIYRNFWECYDGSTWQVLRSIYNNPYIYEEAIWWNETSRKTTHTWVQTLSDANHSIYYICTDSDGNSRTSPTYWLHIDTISPVITTHSYTNTTRISPTQIFNITTDENSWCNVSINGTVYGSVTNGTTHHNWTKTLGVGNYSAINYTCKDAYNNTGISATYWLTIGHVTLVSPTPANNTNSSGKNWIYVNSTTNFAASSCSLDWNGTNISIGGSDRNFYINKTATNGTYRYKVYCNDGDEWHRSEMRNYTINTTVPDTTPPTFTLFYPDPTVSLPSTSGGITFAFRVWTDEPVSQCRYSQVLTGFANMTLMPTLNAGLQYYSLPPSYYGQSWSDETPAAGSSRCWYLMCNDTHGNLQTGTTQVCYAVSSAGGGGGGGGVTIIGNPDNFVLYQQSGSTQCTGLSYCRNSVSYNSLTRAFDPIPFESYGSSIQSPNSVGEYTVCNIASHDSVLKISILGYTVKWGNTSEFIEPKNSTLVMPNGECRTFGLSVEYPESANESFSNSDLHPYLIRISGVQKNIDIPITSVNPPRNDIGRITGAMIAGLPWFWWLGIIFIGVFLILVFRKR